MLSVLAIVEDTTVDGPGFRTAIYAAGCPNHCPGCHNPESWEITRGTWMETEEVVARVMADEFANVTFSGGDPKARSQKTIWCYTGYRYEELLRHPQQAHLLRYIDVLVDGPFVQALRDESLLFRGSSNQRLIDVPASLQAGEVVLFRYDPYL